jgi:hypothetical protein
VSAPHEAGEIARLQLGILSEIRYIAASPNDA